MLTGLEMDLSVHRTLWRTMLPQNIISPPFLENKKFLMNCWNEVGCGGIGPSPRGQFLIWFQLAEQWCFWWPAIQKQLLSVLSS